MLKQIFCLSLLGMLVLSGPAGLFANETMLAVKSAGNGETSSKAQNSLKTKHSGPADAAHKKVAIVMPVNGGTAAEKAMAKLLGIPAGEHQASCLRSVIQQDFMGKEMFAVEKCPLIKGTTLGITSQTDQPSASKGRLEIKVTCDIKNNDYYMGKLKKSFHRDANATITADYIYALDDLSLKNVETEGDQFCAHPIKLQIKKYE